MPVYSQYNYETKEDGYQGHIYIDAWKQQACH